MIIGLPQRRTVKLDTHEGVSPDTLEASQISARGLAARVEDAQRPALARAFVYRTMLSWWSRRTRDIRSPVALRPLFQAIEIGHLPQEARALADGIGEAAALLDAETAAHHFGLIYTGMLPRQYRAALGLYYTPPVLTTRLIDQATAAGVDWTNCRILDPACGGGAFLAPVAQRILDELPGCSPRILLENIANRLRGYEIEPFGAWLSQVTLDAVLLPVTRETGRQLPVVITVCDSLRQSPPHERFDLVIGNPPYGRVRLDAEDRARFKRSLYGHANLYGLFTDLALGHAAPDGVIAFVTPTGFLAGEYFKNLRALLGREAPPATIDFVSVRRGVFEDVLQETLLATYRRGFAPRPVGVHEITPANGTGLAIKEAGETAIPADPSQPWVLPRSPLQAPLVARLSRMTHRLADWGYAVSTGPLVWNRHKGQLKETPGRNSYPLIWAEAVTSTGKFIWRAEKRNHLPWFEAEAGDDWLVTRRPCVLLQRTTAKEQHRRLIAAALPSDFIDRHGAVVIENHLNMLRPMRERPLIASDVLAAFLNSAAADRVFRCVSGSVAVSAYELESLPLPAPAELGGLARVVRRRAERDRIEAECARLYDGAA